MAKTGRKAITLDTPEDWVGMTQHAKHLAQTQKDKSTVIGELDIESEVCFILGIYSQYLLSLQYLDAIRARLNGAKPTNASTNTRGKSSRGNSKKKKLNLDSLEDDEEPGEDKSQAEKQFDEFTKSKNLLTNCQVCGKHIYCKINKYGVHVALKFPQILGWAHAIVSELDDVVSLCTHMNHSRLELWE